MAVGNLPCELPREASEAFSAALAPFIPGLAATDFGAPHDKLALPPELERALILHHGKFTPEYASMEQFVYHRSVAGGRPRPSTEASIRDPMPTTASALRLP